jgi:asparagine synthase (glutamine-hydrolysing)
MARKHVVVALSGDGGDEVFAGYARYAALQEEWSRYGRLPRWVRRGISAARHLCPVETRTWNKLRRIALPREDGYAVFRANFNIPMRQRLFSADFGRLIRPDLTADLFPNREPDVTDGPYLSLLMNSDFSTYLSADVLTKVDRMSMAHSLEIRAPFLDHQVVEFVQRLPLDFLFQRGNSKRILRDLIAPHLPPEVLTHRKQGFSVPLKSWFQGALKSMLEETLESEVYRRSGMFNANYVHHLHALHKDGKAELSWQMWQLLMFGRWHAAMFRKP